MALGVISSGMRCAAIIATLACAGLASAGPWSYSSSVDPATGKPRPSKAITLDAKPNWATDYQWEWTYKVDTYAMEKNVVDDPKAESDTLKGFNAGGTTKSQKAEVGGSVAEVFSQFSAAAGAAGITGNVWVWGDGAKGAAPAKSSGASRSELRMRWVAKDAKNKVKLNTGWKITRAFGSGGTNEAAKISDPWDFRIFDIERDLWLIDSRLWEADCDVLDGSATFENGTFTTAGTGPGSLTIRAGHELMGGTGSLELRWDQGVITSAVDDGIFDGLLPAIGTSALLPLFHIGDAEGNLFFDVNMGDETTAGYRWEMGLGIEGTNGEDVVPAPAGVFVLTGLGLAIARRRR